MATIVGTLVNNGSLFIGGGATLNLTNSFSVTDVPSGVSYQIDGTFNAGPNNAFANLTSIEGAVILGQPTDIMPNGGLMTIASGGGFSVENSSTITIHGDVNNSGSLYTENNPYNSGHNTLNITGTLTNNNDGGAFFLWRAVVRRGNDRRQRE